MTFPWRPTSAGSLAKHVARLGNVLARASFWAVCFHYFGSEGFLFVAAGWMFMLGVKDLTFARVRLTSLEDEGRRGRAVRRSLAAEAGLLVLRLAALLAIALLLRPFSTTVAAFVWSLMICPLFWVRETSSTLMRAYRVARLGTYVTLLAGVGGLVAVVYFAETGARGVEAAIGALIVREAISFVGMTLGALAGRLGLRFGDDSFEDEEEGRQQFSVTGTGGEEIRSPWKLLIADNVVWSRWRLVQFASRFIASGMLGPFGNIGARLFFTYRQPGAYVHRSERLSARKVALFAAGSTVMLLVLVTIGQRFGLLHALGITIAGFMFRLASHAANALFWRQLTPLIATGAKLRLPGRPQR